jgi:ABC-type taurine transport system ATPase subunit
MATLELRHLTVRYAVSGVAQTALSDVSLKLQGDDFVVALGDARGVKSLPEFIALREEVLGLIQQREPAHV